MNYKKIYYNLNNINISSFNDNIIKKKLKKKIKL